MVFSPCMMSIGCVFLGGSELITEWVLVGRLSHESQNALGKKHVLGTHDSTCHTRYCPVNLSASLWLHNAMHTLFLSSQPWWRNCTAWILEGKSCWRPVSQESELPRSVRSQTDIYIISSYPCLFMLICDSTHFPPHNSSQPSSALFSLHSFVCFHALLHVQWIFSSCFCQAVSTKPSHVLWYTKDLIAKCSLSPIQWWTMTALLKMESNS